MSTVAQETIPRAGVCSRVQWFQHLIRFTGQEMLNMLIKKGAHHLEPCEHLQSEFFKSANMTSKCGIIKRNSPKLFSMIFESDNVSAF
jgi:hypothetical protein